MMFLLSWIVSFAVFFAECAPAAVAVPAAYGIYRKITRSREAVPFWGKFLCGAAAVLLFLLLLPLPYFLHRLIVGLLTPGGYL